MDNTYETKGFFGRRHNREKHSGSVGHHRGHGHGLGHGHGSRHSLLGARMNTEYTIKNVDTNNHEVQDFLFTLGCYEGEPITVISVLANQFVVVVKDARYSIDRDLAECILV